MNCPACHRRLPKWYLRSLSPVQWLKLQVSNWMTAWSRELEANRIQERKKARQAHPVGRRKAPRAIA